MSHRGRVNQEKSQSSPSASVERRTKPRQKIKCDICAVSMDTAASLSVHMRLWHSTKNFICEHCDQEFKTESERKSHFFTAHADIYKFECDICNERYSVLNAKNGGLRNTISDLYVYSGSCSRNGFTDTNDRHTNTLPGRWSTYWQLTVISMPSTMVKRIFAFRKRVRFATYRFPLPTNSRII